MRGTRHNARGMKHSSNGYVVNHNDREFDLQDADNIDAQKSSENLYCNCYNKKFYRANQKQMTFEDVEKKYYEEHYRQQWQEQQERYKSKRQYKYMKDFDAWRQSKRYCPEEQVLQIGNVDEHATAEQTKKIMTDYINALERFSLNHNNFLQILDVAYHADEAVPHVHVRYTYQYQENDHMSIGQNKSLEAAGFELPYPEKEEGRFNNRKMTFDKIMRETFLDICERHGINVERDPEMNAKHDRSKKKLIADKKRQNETIEQKNDKLRRENTELKSENDNLKQQIIENYKKIQNATNLSEDAIVQLAEKIIRDREQRLKRQQQRIDQAEQIIDIPGQKHRKKNGKISPADDKQFS